MASYWEEESYPVWADLQQVLVFGIVWPLARLLLNFGIFERLGRRVISSKAGGRQGHLVRRDRHLETWEKSQLIKFQESSWKLVYFSLAEIYAILITYPEPWFRHTAAFWDGWPGQSIKRKLKLYYAAQGGFYLYSVAALVGWETRRKDFGVMMTHHLVTIVLLGYSYYTG
eukprot:jgi/Mesen1/10583/ME000085S09915